MADEPIKPNSPVDPAALMAEVESLRKSNREILDDYKKAKEAAKAVPPDVDVDALIAYKQKKEQEELEAKGRYDEAMAKQAQQYRDAEESKNKRIQELEAKQSHLERENQTQIRQNAKVLRLDTQKILQKVRPVRLIGLTKQSGKLY